MSGSETGSLSLNLNLNMGCASLRVSSFAAPVAPEWIISAANGAVNK